LYEDLMVILGFCYSNLVVNQTIRGAGALPAPPLDPPLSGGM